MMKLRKIALIALAAIGVASMPAKANAQFDRGTIETVAAMLLAEKLGLDPQIFGGLLGGGGGGLLDADDSLFDLAPAVALQRYAPAGRLDDMIDLRGQGLGWDAIANRTGVSDANYRRLRSSGQLDNNNLWRSTVINELHLSSDTVSQMRNMGFSWRDIVATTLISRESGRPLSEVAYRFRADRDWSRVASRYGVTRQEMANRVSSWRSRRSLPAAWARNSTRWTPPGLAKKGGLPPGQAKKIRRVVRTWDDDRGRRKSGGPKWKGNDGRAMFLRSNGNGKGHGRGHGGGKWKGGPGNSGKHGGHGGRGKGKG